MMETMESDVKTKRRNSKLTAGLHGAAGTRGNLAAPPDSHAQEQGNLPVWRGELALLVVVVMNSLGVVLMLHANAGISAISSVPYAFSLVLPRLSLGTWTYLFQGALVCALFLLRRRFVFSYLLSFAVGFAFGLFVDLHQAWVERLPQTLPLCLLYFVIGYVLIAVGIALSNRCKMPIIPTDLFPRELSAITGAAYSRIKISFDVSCLLVTALLTGLCLGSVQGLGLGTVLAAFTTGKAVGVTGAWMDRRVRFTSVFERGRSVH